MLSIFSSLFPPKCIRCCKIGSPLCIACSKTLHVSRGADLPGIDQCWSAGAYSGWLRESVLRFKSGHIEYADGLSEVLKQVLKNAKLEVDCIVNIPSTIHKVRARGFDTVGELSRQLAKRTNIKQISVLQFARPIQDQVGLHRQARARNLERAFTASELISGRIALIDDVITTGATVVNAAKILRICGAKKIFAISLCRT